MTERDLPAEQRAELEAMVAEALDRARLEGELKALRKVERYLERRQADGDLSWSTGGTKRMVETWIESREERL